MAKEVAKRNWLSTKIYQFEVTYALYMLDPWEKAIICKYLAFFYKFKINLK